MNPEEYVMASAMLATWCYITSKFTFSIVCRVIYTTVRGLSRHVLFGFGELRQWRDYADVSYMEYAFDGAWSM